MLVLRWININHYHLYKQHRRPSHDHRSAPPMGHVCWHIHPENCLKLHNIRYSAIFARSLAQIQLPQQVAHCHREALTAGTLPVPHMHPRNSHDTLYPRCYWSRLQLGLRFRWTHQQGELEHVLCLELYKFIVNHKHKLM